MQNAGLVFRGCRLVAHAAVQSADKELDRHWEMCVITPVSHRCAGFLTGLNKALQSFDYPLPVPENIFTSFNGGKVFSQIDLSGVYLQIELSADAKKMVVINAHRGLFQYSRLPFGRKTAFGTFQQIMKKMVSGLK